MNIDKIDFIFFNLLTTSMECALPVIIEFIDDLKTLRNLLLISQHWYETAVTYDKLYYSRAIQIWRKNKGGYMYAYAFGYRDDRTFHFCLFNQYKTYSGVFKDAFDMCLSDYIYGVKGTMDRESALAILNERMNNGLFRIYIVGL